MDSLIIVRLVYYASKMRLMVPFVLSLILMNSFTLSWYVRKRYSIDLMFS